MNMLCWQQLVLMHPAGQRAFASLPIAEPQEPQLPPFDHIPAPYDGPSRDEVLALRKQYLSPGAPAHCLHMHPSTTALPCIPGSTFCARDTFSMWCMHANDTCAVHAAALFHHFKQPIMITEGKMQYLYDERGRRYLDVRCLLALHACMHACMHACCLPIVDVLQLPGQLLALIILTT